MMKKQIMDSSLKLSSVMLALLGAAQTPFAATEVGCSLNGCQIGYSGNATWSVIQRDSGTQDTISADAVNITIPAGKYQNIAKTESGYGYNSFGSQKSQKVEPLFNIYSHANYNQNNHLTLKSGINAVIQQAFDGSSLLSIWGVDTTIEKGVTLTVEKSYSAFNNIPTEYDLAIGGIAIEIRGGATLNTQADIVLNAEDAMGIQSYSAGTVVNASNHSITMNEKYNIALSLVDDGIMNIDHVSIIGNADNQVAVDIGGSTSDKNQAAVNIKNSIISLNDSSTVYFPDQLAGSLNLTDSTASAGYGVTLLTETANSNPTLNINGGSLSGKKALLAINPAYIVDEVEMDNPEGSNSANFTLNATNKAKLSGISEINPDIAHGKIAMNLTDGSSWTFNGNSELSELNVTDSSVSFEKGTAFHTLTINGDLGGNNGTFNMNTDLASQQADKLIVNGTVSGAHLINVSDSRNEPNAANGKVTLVETNGGSGSFSLVQPYVDAGVYRYTFAKDQNNWILQHSGVATTDNTAPIVPGNDNENNNSGDKELSAYANSLVSMRQAARSYLYSSGQSVQNRMISLQANEKDNGVWILAGGGRDKADGYSTIGANTSGFSQDNRHIMLGYDHQANGYFIGALAHYGTADIDFNHGYGDGKLKAYGAGIYGGSNWDNGLFVHADYRYTRLKSEATKTDDVHWNAHNLRFGTGITLPLTSVLSVVPQVQIETGRISSDHYADSDTYYRTSVGAQLRGDFTLIKPFIGAYWVKDYGDNDIRINQYTLQAKNFGDRLLAEIGVAAQTAIGEFKVSAQHEHGGHYQRNAQLNLGYTYQW